jgi:hypothetical protein
MQRRKGGQKITTKRLCGEINILPLKFLKKTELPETLSGSWFHLQKRTPPPTLKIVPKATDPKKVVSKAAYDIRSTLCGFSCIQYMGWALEEIDQ